MRTEASNVISANFSHGVFLQSNHVLNLSQGMFSCECLHIGGGADALSPGTVLIVLLLLQWKGLIVPWRKVLTSACLVDFCVLGKLFTLAVN